MSPRLDLPLAVAAWVIGFGILALTGSLAPLAALAIAAAVRLVAGDAATRRLLRPTPGATAAGVAVGLASVAATYLLYGTIAELLPELPRSVRGLYRILSAGAVERWVLALVVAAVGAAEEIVWRGRLLPGDPGAAPALGRPELATIAGASALYGAVHLASGSWLLPLAAFACGLGWALLRVVTRSLWAPLVAHLTWSSAVLLLRPLG